MREIFSTTTRRVGVEDTENKNTRYDAIHGSRRIFAVGGEGGRERESQVLLRALLLLVSSSLCYLPTAHRTPPPCHVIFGGVRLKQNVVLLLLPVRYDMDDGPKQKKKGGGCGPAACWPRGISFVPS